MHLADAFIQSDLQCIQVTVFTFYQLLLSLGIEPMILALLTPCSTSWATGKFTTKLILDRFLFSLPILIYATWFHSRHFPFVEFKCVCVCVCVCFLFFCPYKESNWCPVLFWTPRDIHCIEKHTSLWFEKERKPHTFVSFIYVGWFSKVHVKMQDCNKAWGNRLSLLLSTQQK